MCGVASVSMRFSMCVHTSQHWYKLEESQNGQSSGKKTSVQGDPWTSALPKEEMNGEEVEEVWQMTGSRKILIHTAKERISEDVVGIVVFASVSSRSMARDPILDSVRSQFVMGHVRYSQRTSPSCTRQGKHGRHGKHHRGTTHKSMAHRIAKRVQTGKSGPIPPISKGP